MSEYGERANALFCAGYNCAQSTFAALCPLTGLFLLKGVILPVIFFFLLLSVLLQTIPFRIELLLSLLPGQERFRMEHTADLARLKGDHKTEQQDCRRQSQRRPGTFSFANTLLTSSSS